MSANTSPDNIVYPTGEQEVNLPTDLAAMAGSVQDAFTTRDTQMFLQFTTKADMNASPGTKVGQHATVYADTTVTNRGDYRWTGSAWVSNLQDTGSLTVINGSGFNGSLTSSAINGVGMVEGLWTPAASGSFTSSFTTLGTLNALTAPRVTITLTPASSLPSVLQVYISPDGLVAARTLGGSVGYTTSSSISINGFSWRV